MPDIHPSAVVDRGAELHESCVIGPYCIVGGDVTLGAGVRLHSHVVLGGHTTVGEGSEIFPFASVGSPPQDRKYKGEATRLTIGRGCTIREHVTINPGTVGGGGVTEIGERCLFLIGAHVAHDCHVGRNVTFINGATLGGHCHIADHVILGGLSAVHQSVRIGEYAFVGGMSAVENDIIPFGMALGNRASLGGLNIVGLTRNGFSREAIHRLRRAYRMMFAPEGTLKERVADVEDEFADDAHVRRMVEFVRGGGERGICVPRARGGDL